MTQAGPARIRWAAPDGRKGRWRKTIAGAVISAVATRYTDPCGRISVQFDTAASVALWPGLKDEGWTLEQESRQKR